jgi:hypothetical protein
MLVRIAIACACVVGAASAAAEELGPEQARAFVVGKLFAYTCFDGTAGMGRIFSDGSVVGTIRPGGAGEVRFAALPAGTIKVEGAAMCAHLAGLPIQPCFKVERLDYRSFRGSVSGLGFAYCDFYQHNPRAEMVSRAPEEPVRLTRRVSTRVSTRTAPLAPAQAAPIVPVESSPIGLADAKPAAQSAPSSSAPPSSASPASTPAAPTASTPGAEPAPPIATLRPAIND